MTTKTNSGKKIKDKKEEEKTLMLSLDAPPMIVSAFPLHLYACVEWQQSEP